MVVRIVKHVLFRYLFGNLSMWRLIIICAGLFDNRGKDSVKAMRKVQSNAHLFKSVQEGSVHIELGSQRLNRSYFANALAAAAATDDDDDDRNYLHINLSGLVILYMIRSGKYPHAYRDCCSNRGSSVIALPFARLHSVIPEDPSLHSHIS